jgi:hypothetical protein
VEDDQPQSSFDDVLEPTAIQVRDDEAVAAAEHWQSCLETFSHASTVGISGEAERVGLAKCSSLSLRWPARPILTGRFGWGNPHSATGDSDSPEYDSGERLGDVVLAAEQSLGSGRVVVLGNTTPLSNDASPATYDFTGRLLGYLADPGGGPQAWWRQLLGLLAIAALVAVLAWQMEAWRTGLTALALGASLAISLAVSCWSGQVLPDGHPHSPNNVAYIDASHLEAYSRDSQGDLGLGALTRVLTRDGYLPLLLPEVTAERLERAGVLISIAPAKPFSPAERQVVHQFVKDGGVLICMVGAEEAPANRELLADYGFRVPHSPVGPNEDVREPEPAGAYYSSYLTLEKYRTYMRFYAGWPVECAEADVEVLKYGPGDIPMIIRRTVGRGSVTVVGDTHFASNWNLLQATRGQPTENEIFWRWFLSRITGRKEWLPPEPIRESGPLGEEGAGMEQDGGEGP